MQALLSEGHVLSEIHNYTWQQFVGFCAAVDRLRRRRMLEQLNLFITGSRGDEKSVNEFVSGLEEK